MSDLLLILKDPVEAASNLASFDPRGLGINRFGAMALAGGKLWVFKPDSTTAAATDLCVVPTKIAATAAYIADPTTAPGRWEPNSTGASAADLASTATGKGASLVGIFDTAGRFTGANVEAALIEVATLAELASTASGKGATLIALRDVDNHTAQTTVEGAIAELYVLVAAAGGPAKKRLTLAYNNAALTATSAGANGDSATINIDTALPNNARVISYDVSGLTSFTGGGISECKGTIGTSGDVDAIAKDIDLFAAAVDGGPAAMAPGIRPGKFFASGGQLGITLTPDAGHKLSQLTAGSAIIDVLYEVLP
jgi:hypothetical protein